MPGRLLLKRRNCRQSASRFSDGARYGYESIKRLVLNYQTLKANTLVPDDDLGWSEGMNVGSSTYSTGYGHIPQEKGYGYASVMAALLNDQDLNCYTLVLEKSVVLDNDMNWPYIHMGSIVKKRGTSHDNDGDERIGFGSDTLKSFIVVGLCLLMLFNGPKANEWEEIERTAFYYWKYDDPAIFGESKHMEKNSSPPRPKKVTYTV
jgi:hypothetical protein